MSGIELPHRAVEEWLAKTMVIGRTPCVKAIPFEREATRHDPVSSPYMTTSPGMKLA